jgi:Zinc finger, C2H2 type
MLRKTIFLVVLMNVAYGMELFNLDDDDDKLDFLYMSPVSSYSDELLASGISYLEPANLTIPQSGSIIPLALSCVSASYTLLPFKCLECEKKFRSEQSLENHVIKKHRDIQKVLCPYPNCEKFHTQYEHIQLKRSQKFACDCGKTFSKNCLYKRHLKTHDQLPSQTKSEGKHCVICTQKFNSLKDYDLHVKQVHEIDQIFSCPHGCDNEYTSRKSLILHILRKHKEPKFFCEYCDAQFTMECDLTQHHKRGHKGVVGQ